MYSLPIVPWMHGDEPVIEVGDELVAVVLRRAGEQVAEHHDAGRALPRLVALLVPRALAGAGASATCRSRRSDTPTATPLSKRSVICLPTR